MKWRMKDVFLSTDFDGQHESLLSHIIPLFCSFIVSSRLNRLRFYLYSGNNGWFTALGYIFTHFSLWMCEFNLCGNRVCVCFMNTSLLNLFVYFICLLLFEWSHPDDHKSTCAKPPLMIVPVCENQKGSGMWLSVCVCERVTDDSITLHISCASVWRPHGYIVAMIKGY